MLVIHDKRILCIKIIFFLSDNEYHGYIIKLTDVKMSPSKVKYFNAIMHNGEEEKSLVSYNPQLHQTMEAAKLKDKPIKLRNFFERHDEFQGKAVLTLNDRSHIEYSTNMIPFSLIQDQMGRFNRFSIIKDIIDSVEIHEMVNLVAHVSLKNSMVQDIQTQYGIKRKRDLEIYDDTGTIKLSLWGNHVDLVSSDGNYKFKDLRVRCYNGKYLTTTALTVIATSEVSFEDRKDEGETYQTAILSFPAVTIESFEENFYCKKCQYKSIPCGKLLVCEKCGSKSLLNQDDRKYNVKAVFLADDDVSVSIAIPHNVFCKFLNLLESQPATKEDKEIELLSNVSIELTYTVNNHMAIDMNRKC